jgi:poly-gamma-glutamate system protein
MMKMSPSANREAPSAKNNKIIWLYVLSGLCLIGFLVFKIISGGEDPAVRYQMHLASRLMAGATAAIRDCRLQKGIPIDPKADPNRTGLIGLPTSSITTSLGILEAKRTTTNPAFAGLLVRLLHRAGVRPGDAVAVGASSSFPALILAVLAACRAMNVEPLVISSLGSSEWGANIPEFNWLDMMDCLNATGSLTVHLLAFSIGGDEDRGNDMSPDGRALLLREAVARHLSLLEEPDLAATVAARMRLYDQSAGGKRIKAFINVGGSWVNLGTDSKVLGVKPGLNMKGGPAEIAFFPPPERSGMIFAMARRGIPVIHLLFIRGLCRDYGFPWDPQPLPRGE